MSALRDTIITLSNGVRMPQCGFGTYQLKGAEAVEAVKTALSAGVHAIDTAAVYHNEEEVAAAVEASGIPREQLFLTTKLQPKDQGEGAYDAMCASLARLRVTYIDLALIHWPGTAGIALDDPLLKEKRKASWLALQRLYEEGKARAIGVSNYMPLHLDELCSADWCTVRPHVNQFELHPMLQQREAVAACERWGVAVEAYSSLARGEEALWKHAAVVAAASAHGVSVPQVLLRWAIQHGWIVIPKSASPERIVTNTHVFGWELTHSEMHALDALDAGLRKCWDPNTVLQ